MNHCYHVSLSKQQEHKYYCWDINSKVLKKIDLNIFLAVRGAIGATFAVLNV